MDRQMALNIKDPETDRLARRLSRLTGESITLAVRTAVLTASSKERTRGKASVEELLAIARRIAEAPNLDERSDDAILGYDERGLPGRWWSTAQRCSRSCSSNLKRSVSLS
jgi:antitoxin VapB